VRSVRVKGATKVNSRRLGSIDQMAKARKDMSTDKKSMYQWAVEQAAETKVGKWTDEQKAELVDRMNEEYAAAVAGSGFVYVCFGHNDAGAEMLEFRSKSGLQQQFANVIVHGTLKNPITAFDYWLAHPARKTFAGGVVFKPAGYGETPRSNQGSSTCGAGLRSSPRPAIGACTASTFAL
jgi:hypothetical protein